ncbi:exosome complex exonuclease Rrp41 [Candidatus Woesearchaeota archaeon]|jgi:exosome complex component RRP41|nr:exosome complex exonuclease Rrp41 [Candidatus Woesearchaeota archaeon]|tara:strand:- start:17222 stop:17908 length:687 start_codon:yes stop_codon:yes gene_type:complete
MKRPDGRNVDELRKIEAKAGIIKRADGSASFKIGNTIAYAAVYGPRNLYPRFLQNPEKGILRCNYNMMPFSGSGERIRPGSSRRSKEISLVTEKALLPVINLGEFPNSVIDIFIEFPQTDAGSRCAGICAASIALAEAGVPMKELVAAVAVGIVNGEVVVDLSKEEEDMDGAVDIPIAITTKSNNISLLQMDGMIKQEDIKKAIELGKKASQKIFELQKKAIKDKYNV